MYLALALFLFESMHSTAMTTLYVARHGQSEWNNQGRVTGQLDPGLSATGIEQSEGLARCLQGEALDAIYSSALRRTLATAAPTAATTGLPVVPLAALNEIHVGVLQGRFRDERDAEAQALWARWKADLWGACLPGGERFDQFARRVGAALQDILQRHEGQRVLIVGHSATNRVVLGTLLGWPRERWHELRPRNKYLYRLQLGAAEPEIATYTLSGSKTGRCEPGFVT
jgi:2,3-bisphosphoglycerate-dependent phosphoglycerate mutase